MYTNKHNCPNAEKTALAQGAQYVIACELNIIIKVLKFNFSDKLCDTQNNIKKQNCLFQKDLQILFRPFFYWNNSFPYKHEKCY